MYCKNLLPVTAEMAYNHQCLRDVAQFGSALRSGRRGRWFESSHPDFC